jgi:hypothetical protein
MKKSVSRIGRWWGVGRDEKGISVVDALFVQGSVGMFNHLRSRIGPSAITAMVNFLMQVIPNSFLMKNMVNVSKSIIWTRKSNK